MARVERGNVVLHVDDADIQHYIALGYKHTDEMGKVLQDTIPYDVSTLQKAYVDKDKKIAELESTIATLTAELTTLKKVEKPATKKTTKSTKKTEE